MSKKHQKKDVVYAVPTGKSSDGKIFFVEGDLSRHSGLSLSLLPPGDVPLMLDPSHEYNKPFGEYQGQLIPIYCQKEVGTGIRIYQCKHVIKEDKDNNVIITCQMEWPASSNFNIASLQAHARDGVWRKTANVSIGRVSRVGSVSALE